MRPDAARFIAVQVVGGVAVLGSYAVAIRDWPDTLGGLWGTIPPAVIPAYTACMPFAAVGYLLAAGWWLRQGEGLDRVTGWFAAFLGASALWMPMSCAAFAAGDARLLPWIQVDLAITAVASLVVLAETWRAASGRWGRAAVVGWALLCGQTVVLDALIWPRYFVV